MIEHHETTARALLLLASRRTAYARAQVTRPSEDGDKDATLAEYLAAVEAVEQIADRRVVRFDRAAALERMRELAAVSEEALGAEADRLGAMHDAIADSIMSRLERESQDRRREASPLTQPWSVGAPDGVTDWRASHYGTLHTPPLDRDRLRARGFDVQRDTRYDHIEAWQVTRDRGGDIRETVSEDHPAEQDAWEFANAFVFGTQDPPPQRETHDRQDPETQQDD